MPKYNVSMIRLAYQFLTIKVEAETEEAAHDKAEDTGGNHLFPTESYATYEVDEVNLITEEK